MIKMPRLKIQDGALQLLKWMGLVCMSADHINKYLFNGTLPYCYQAGRLAMPLFVFVLAYNLARPQLDNSAHHRILQRLTFFAILSSVPYIALGDVLYGWWPLNILFTLLVLTTTIYFAEKRQWLLAVALFVIGGGAVEFCWFALLFGVSIWAYTRNPNVVAALIAVLSIVLLYFVNKNLWALTVFPLLLFTRYWQWKIPRCRWLFYWYYPGHLTLLWLIRIPMARAGYLFF